MLIAWDNCQMFIFLFFVQSHLIDSEHDSFSWQNEFDTNIAIFFIYFY